MNILITGGSGFIGRNLVEYLKSKYQVFAPAHNELELLNDSAVREYFNSYKFDIVIHSAVRPGHRNAKDPSNQLYNNLRMFFNIVRNSGKFGKLIFLSSGAVYDVTKPMVKVKEEDFDTYIPGDEHGFSKYIIAKQIEKINNAVELRIFGIFGKYEDYTIRFISNAICKALCDLPITIKQNRRFDYIYIEDFIRIVNYFIENKSCYKSYNITPDRSVELYELAEKVCKISKKNIPIKVFRDGLGLQYSGDNGRLHKEMPGVKFTTIDGAIADLYAWYLGHRSLINQELLFIDK